MTNIHFIRAAILEHTGIELSLERTRDILVEEGMLYPSKAKNILFRGYAAFYDFFYKQDENLIEEKKEQKIKDLVELIGDTDD